MQIELSAGVLELMSNFDPKEFFDEKAKRFKDDPELAACGFNRLSNQCMTRVQEKALQTAIRKIGGRNGSR